MKDPLFTYFYVSVSHLDPELLGHLHASLNFVLVSHSALQRQSETQQKKLSCPVLPEILIKKEILIRHMHFYYYYFLKPILCPLRKM